MPVMPSWPDKDTGQTLPRFASRPQGDPHARRIGPQERGDHFRAHGDEIEKTGVHLLDARVFMDDDLAEEGIMVKERTKSNPNTLSTESRSPRKTPGWAWARRVVSRGTVLAIEAFEGTNAMIKRAGTFGANNCVFVKLGKPNQDTRFQRAYSAFIRCRQ